MPRYGAIGVQARQITLTLYFAANHNTQADRRFGTECLGTTGRAPGADDVLDPGKSFRARKTDGCQHFYHTWNQGTTEKVTVGKARTKHVLQPDRGLLWSVKGWTG